MSCYSLNNIRKLKIYSLTLRWKDVDHKKIGLNSPILWRAGDDTTDSFWLGSVRLQAEAVWGCRSASISGLGWAVEVWKAPRQAKMRVISPNTPLERVTIHLSFWKLLLTTQQHGVVDQMGHRKHFKYRIFLEGNGFPESRWMKDISSSGEPEKISV